MEHIGQGPQDLQRGLPQASGRQESYYRVLDVDTNASRMEIREAYLRLKNTFASGSAALYSLISEEEAGEQMAAVEEAFRILNDDVARRDYDLNLGLARALPRQGAAAAALLEPALPADPVSLHTERLLYAREQTEAPRDQDLGNDVNRIKTTRSSLPIIKLKANGVSSEEVQTRLAKLIEGSDLGDGDLFKRLREACDVGEDEMCERTKICVSYIRAIEVNRFERLPQAVYVKGFLRSYFRYLGLVDCEKLVLAFSARLMDWQVNRKG